MPKNIVVFADGTGQAGGVRAEQNLSNIYKLYRASAVGPDNAIDPKEQIAFYDAGLGTDDDVSAITGFMRRAKKLFGLVTGRGMTTNIIDCYQFIINHYAPGDRIFLFGFSRGAYTARCVSNVISLCGVPTNEEGGGPLPVFRARMREIATKAVREVYEHGQSHDRAAYEAERDEQGRRFRAQFGSGTDDNPNVGTYFIGVFDAVAALGAKGVLRTAIVGALIVLFLISVALLAVLVDAIASVGFLPAFVPLTLILGAFSWRRIHRSRRREIRGFPKAGDTRRHSVAWRGDKYDGSLSRSVTYARHAISIDERRADFDRVIWGNRNVIRTKEGGETLEPFIQMWFAGNHSDIGGSYAETESRLSDISLQWMIDQASELPVPLIYNERRLNLFPSADGLQHCEIASTQDKIEALLPQWFKRIFKPAGYAIKVRKIEPHFLVHRTVEERFLLNEVGQCGGTRAYRPEALKNHEKFRHGYPADGESCSIVG